MIKIIVKDNMGKTACLLIKIPLKENMVRTAICVELLSLSNKIFLYKKAADPDQIKLVLLSTLKLS